MSSPTWGQVVPLVRLRWRMVRSVPRRVAVIVLAMGFALIVVGIIVSAGGIVSRLGLEVFATQALVAYPVALLLFGVIAVIAPFLAGGAIELFPASQLVAYPVTPRTRFTLSLMLMPFNLTWLLQVVLLAGLVAVGTGGTGRLWTLAGVTTAFVIAATVAGQALAWTGTAVRLTRAGRAITNLVAVALLVVVAANANQESIFELADRTPLVPVLDAGLSPFGARWVVTVLLLLGIVWVAALAGVIAVGWTLRLGTETAGLHEGTHRQRRTQHRSVFGMITMTLLSSVYRSKPIRRGLLLLVVLPVAVAAVAELTWTEIVVLPGLVAAGAALLFGVNGFSLVGGGAAWLGSQPQPHHQPLAALALTVGAVVGGSSVVTTVGVAAFAEGRPRSSDLVALAVGSLVSVAWVTATALWLSVRRPYQADLRGNRDAPAPPGVMAGYSLRLAGVAGLFGLCLVVTAQLRSPSGSLTLGLVVLSTAAFRAVRTRRAWRDPHIRSRALMTTAFG